MIPHSTSKLLISRQSTKAASGSAFTLTHGFFFNMGGLAFDMTNDPARFWPRDFNRLMISPELLVGCVSNGYPELLPKISREEIKDKSKANRFAKAVVCIQTTWFCLQFIVRILQSLPVSLLELNTFAHCICVLLIYIFWWHKPLDIEEPLAIPTASLDARLRQLCAKASFYSQLFPYKYRLPSVSRGPFTRKSGYKMSILKDCDMFVHSELGKSEWELNYEKTHFRMNWELGGSPKAYRVRLGHSPDMLLATSLATAECILQVESSTSDSSHTDDQLSDGLESALLHSVASPYVFHIADSNTKVPGTPYKLQTAHVQSCSIDSITLNRLQLASQCSFNEIVDKSMLFHYTPLRMEKRMAITTDPMPFYQKCIEMSSHTEDSIHGKTRGKVTSTSVPLSKFWIGGVALSALFYGGLHTLVFGVPLHTPAETLLWKTSSLVVLCAPPVILGLSILLDEAIIPVFERKGWPKPWKWSLPGMPEINPSNVLVASIISLYAFARVFLVVEVFLNVPYLDPGVYQMPDWSVYFPHVT